MEFTRFFLNTCLDQVSFMEDLAQPEGLRNRILRWTEEQVQLKLLPVRSGTVLEAVLYRGELPRSELSEALNTSIRQAQRIVADLMKADILVSESSRAPLRIAFSATLAPRWMPGLFPEKPTD